MKEVLSFDEVRKVLSTACFEACKIEFEEDAVNAYKVVGHRIPKKRRLNKVIHFSIGTSIMISSFFIPFKEELLQWGLLSVGAIWNIFMAACCFEKKNNSEGMIKDAELYKEVIISYTVSQIESDQIEGTQKLCCLSHQLDLISKGQFNKNILNQHKSIER